MSVRHLLTLSLVVLLSAPTVTLAGSAAIKAGRVLSYNDGTGVLGVRLGSADGKDFPGCTVQSQYLFTTMPLNLPERATAFRRRVQGADVLEMLLKAKELGWTLNVSYDVLSTGRCLLVGVEAR